MSRVEEDRGDLTVTALYTSAVWWWAGFSRADLLITRDARIAFAITNAVLAAAGWIRGVRHSLRHGLADRHRLIDRLATDAGIGRVLELAAGLSRRGAAWSADPAFHYTEVDLPAVVARKRRLLQGTPEGIAVLERLTLVGEDVARVDLDALVPAIPEPVCVIAEGLCMYLDAEEQQQLWRRIAKLIADRPGSLFLFDLVPACEQPPPGRIGRWLGAAMRWATGGADFVTDDRTRHDIAEALVTSGFGGVSLHEPPPGGVPAAPMLVFVCTPTASAVS